MLFFKIRVSKLLMHFSVDLGWVLVYFHKEWFVDDSFDTLFIYGNFLWWHFQNCTKNESSFWSAKQICFGVDNVILSPETGFLISLRGQTLHFVNCKRIPQQGRSFVLLLFFHFLWSFQQNFIMLETCLWNPGTYRHKIVRLTSAQVWPCIAIQFFQRALKNCFLCCIFRYDEIYWRRSMVAQNFFACTK